tara:strand:- start:2668 stop:3225 length:558 start_codon:yes stop_codon:yes gene_type:complete
MIQAQNFLSNYPDFRSHCDNIDYSGITSPVDGVFYEGVSTHIPESVQIEVKANLDALIGRPVKINHLFMRLSKEGVNAPHEAHTDATMGTYSMMLYLNRQDDCKGGTALLRHKSGLDSNPKTQEDYELWEEEQKITDKWEVTEMAFMEENKACVFDAYRMHRSEPTGGFGNNNENGRLVMVAFFD